MYASQGIHNGSPADDSRGFYPDPWESLYVLIRFDESVLAVVAFIYDACAIGLPVIENEEVMAEHVHLQYCLFRIHRFQLELFGADDVVFRIGFVVLFLPEFMVRVHFQFAEQVLLRILLPELPLDLRLMLSHLRCEFVIGVLYSTALCPLLYVLVLTRACLIGAFVEYRTSLLTFSSMWFLIASVTSTFPPRISHLIIVKPLLHCDILPAFIISEYSGC